VSYWGLLYVTVLVVSPKHRSRRVGSQLLEAALKVGADKGCKRCVLETHSFQAPGFYVKNGFTQVGCVHGFCNESKVLRFSKGIVPATSS
jgi:ribosomal protein S18 acetylase RimI-like enzyme